MKPRKKLKVSHGTEVKEQKRTEKWSEKKDSRKTSGFDDVERFSETENLDEVIADDEEEDQRGGISSYLQFLTIRR